MAGDATYVYCLLAAQQAPSTRAAPRPPEGLGPLRSVEAGPGWWLVASTAPLERYGEEALAQGLEDLDWVSQQALAHEAVVEHFLGGGRGLPMRLFTLFLDDERAAAHLDAERERVRALLDRVGDCRELGLRAAFAPERARRAAARASEAAPAAASSPGAAFLLRKKRERDLTREGLALARGEAERLLETLEPRARAVRRRPPPAERVERVLLDAVFLVPRVEEAAFEAAVEAEVAAASAGGLDLTLTGPFPPYHFVEEPA